MEQKNLVKIGVLNFQMGVGTIKGYWQYIFTFWKYILPTSGKTLEKAAYFIKRNQIDILFCTEISESQAKKLSIGFSSYKFFKVLGLNLNHGGDAIFCNFKLLESTVYDLTSTKVKRVLGHLIVEMRGKKVNLFATHLSLSAEIRKIQLKEIAEIINKIDGPIILAGDFNTDEEIIFNKLKSISNLKTFPSWKPKFSYDKIFISAELEFGSINVDSSILFSDHLPLITEITLI